MLRKLKPVAKWAGRKSMWAGAITFLIWSGIEAYDGAHDRLQARYSQAKDVVAPPIESTYDKVMSGATKVWESIEANPVPALMTLSLFAITILYHKMSGSSLKQALANTMLRTSSDPAKPPIILRAEQEILFDKLNAKQKALEDEQKNLPAELEDAKATAEVLVKEANRAQEQTTAKGLRAQAAIALVDSLGVKLEHGKYELAQIKEQLNTLVT